MPVAFTTAQLDKAVLQRTIPQITVWNRLGGRPRADNFDPALRAEVRDALWMITRQWQTGEFQGDDAGSPILAKLRMETTQVRKYSPVGGTVEAFDDTIPLEAKVERRPVPFSESGQDISLDLRLLMGRQWLKMIAAIPGNFAAAFIAKYPIHSPAPDQTADGIYCAHPEAWSAFAAASGRRMDGAKLYLYLTDASHHASDGIAGLAAHQADADAVAARFVAWFEKLIFQPQKNDAWEADRFEYQMNVYVLKNINPKLPLNSRPALSRFVAVNMIGVLGGSVRWVLSSISNSRLWGTNLTPSANSRSFGRGRNPWKRTSGSIEVRVMPRFSTSNFRPGGF